MSSLGRLQLAGPAESVGAAGTLTLCSLAEFQAYIEKPGDSGGAFDILCQTLIDSASHGAFGLMGGRYLKRPATSFDFVLSPDSPEVLWLNQYPIGTISSIQLGRLTGNGVWESSQSLLATEYYADPRSGRVYSFSGWPESKHSVRVVWTGGFDTVPADAKEALIQWAGVKLNRLRKGRWDIRTMQDATTGFTFENELPQSSAGVFAKYSIPEASVA